MFNNDIQNVKKIKKEINSKFGIVLSYKDVLCVFKVNNLYKKEKILKDDIDNFILENIKNNCYTTALEMINKIKNKFNKSISTTYIYNILNKNKYTYKKIKINSNPHSEEKQKIQLEEVKKNISKINIDNLISIDEISIKEFENLNKGWGIKGTETEINNKDKKINNKRYSVLMAASNKKIINYTIVEKGIKTDSFNKFMSKLKTMDKQNNNVYFLDNTRVHKTKSFNQLKEKLKLNIIYNAPYQSKYNPIEYVFSLLRKKIQKDSDKTYNKIINIINKFNKELEETKLKNIFNHVLKLFNNI